MRIRSTKPEFWRSNRVASVDWEDRLVLKGLEQYVDDNGVGKDDIALIVGDLFQRDLVREPSRTLARVSGALTRLNAAGLLWRYVVDGTAYLYVAFWESIQRVDKPQKGRFPRPDGTMNYKDSEIRESVASPREDSRALAPGTGEQGNRGTETPPASPPASAAESESLFDAFPPEDTDETEDSSGDAVDGEIVDDDTEGDETGGSGAIVPAEDANAGAVVKLLIDECTRVGIKLPGQIIGQYGKRIKGHLEEGYTPAQIWAALVLMGRENILNRPSLLTNKLVTVQTGPERPPTRERRSAVDESVAGWQALGEQLAEEAQAT